MNFFAERNYCYMCHSKKSEYTLKHNRPTWEVAYCFHETTIQSNETKFTYNFNPRWGNMESVIQQVENDLLDIDCTLME